MNPHNTVPSRLPRQLNYTDGSPSREYEMEDEEMEKFEKGFAYKKKPCLLDVRDELLRMEELLDVISVSLMSDEPNISRSKIYGAIQSKVLPTFKILEQELSQL